VFEWVFSEEGNRRIFKILTDPTLYRSTNFLFKLNDNVPTKPFKDKQNRAAFDKKKWPGIIEVSPPQGYSKKWIELMPDRADSLVSPFVLAVTLGTIALLAFFVGCVCIVRRRRTRKRRESLNSLRERARASLSNVDDKAMGQFRKQGSGSGGMKSLRKKRLKGCRTI
jgi:cbb3-type cytochrome oxidase subunit 3